jgi:hypothetical protein
MSGTTSNLGSLSAATSISFGRLQSGGNFFEGALDEVAVYGAVLTPLAVTAHYNAGR